MSALACRLSEKLPAGSARSTGEELRRQAAAFRKEHDLDLLEKMPTPAVVLNGRREIVFCNNAFRTLLNPQSGRNHVGRRLGESLQCHVVAEGGVCGEMAACQFCHASQAILQALGDYQGGGECQIRTASGDAMELRIWSHPLSLDGKRAALLFIQDISDEKRRLVFEKIFLHDLLNTAGALLSMSELELNGGGGKSPFADAVFKMSERLVEEIRSHRHLVAAENNDLQPTFERVNVRELSESLVQQPSLVALAEGAGLEVQHEAEDISFISDPVLLGRVLHNMLKNAIEASGKSNPVRLKGQLTGQTVCFSVHNCGEISPEAQAHIFKRSFSTKGVGRGLGTYSMKLLGERYLGGKVSYETSEEGTTFTIELPVLRPRKPLDQP